MQKIKLPKKQHDLRKLKVKDLEKILEALEFLDDWHKLKPDRQLWIERQNKEEFRQLRQIKEKLSWIE